MSGIEGPKHTPKSADWTPVEKSQAPDTSEKAAAKPADKAPKPADPRETSDSVDLATSISQGLNRVKDLITGKGTVDETLSPEASKRADGTVDAAAQGANPLRLPSSETRPWLVKYGDQNEHVRELKVALKEAGFYDGVINDKMGNDGRNALIAAKKELGLTGGEDEAGPFTLQKVREYAAKRNAGGNVNPNDANLQKMARVNVTGYGQSSCVESVFRAADTAGVPTFVGGTAPGHNNPREAMVRTLQAGHWESIPLPGVPSKKVTIHDDIAGKAQAYVISPKDYAKLANEGKIPNGALVFQTQHGWDWNGSAYGNDVAIVRGGGRNPYNFQPNSQPLIYGDATKEIVLLVPKSSLK